MKKAIMIFLMFLLLIKFDVYGQGSWRIAAKAPVFNRIDDINFINDSTAFMGQDGKVYKSVDGGDNWDSIGILPNNAYIRSIEFVNDSTGFIGSIFDAVGGVGLYKTTDGGRHWDRINDVVDGGMYGICGLDHRGSTIIGVGIYSEPGRFYISRNNGVTWQGWQIKESAALVDCLILDENTFLVSGNSPDGRKAVILKSEDGGLTWKEVAKSTHNMTYCWKLSIKDSGLGLGSIEDAPTSFITYDNGSTWEEIAITSDQSSQRFGGAYFFNELLGWLGIQWGSGTYETRDGGKTWNLINFGGAINKITSTSKGRAIATGNTIYIYDHKVSNHPNPVDTPASHRLSSGPNPTDSHIEIKVHIDCQTALRLDIVNSAGQIIKTLAHQNTPAGDYKWDYNFSGLPAGVFFVWMRTNEGHQVNRILVR